MKPSRFAHGVCALALLWSILVSSGQDAVTLDATTGQIGRTANGLETPINQLVTPAGSLIELPGMRPQALALSPDGHLLVTAGLTHELVVLDPETGSILQHVPFPSGDVKEEAPVASAILNPDLKARLSYTGLKFSPDGSRIYLANVNGDIKVFAVQTDHKVVPSFSIGLPPAKAPGRKDAIPAGLAVSLDGQYLYVALNLANRLVELEAATGRLLRTWDVGVAPFDVLLVGHKAYVSNWGGRRPDGDSLTGPAGRGTTVRVDPVRHIASEGSVSVIDLNQSDIPQSRTEIVTGQHASALAGSPDGRHVVVANAGSDTLSVIDTRSDEIVDTLYARQNPADLFGAQPNALAFDQTGKQLFVCNGTQNAIAVFQFKSKSSVLGLFAKWRFKPGKARLLGLIPVGWFPGAVVYDARRKTIDVANIKNLSTGRTNRKTGKPEYNTKQYAGSLSLVPLPSRQELAAMTATALANMRYPLLAKAKLPARPDQSARPVPERVGEPSVFNHVIYIIKENRTYDQVLGDVAEGNGAPELCVFGERVTPNQHKLVREFVLLDNTYCSGVLSADGHQWTDSALATDYVERSFAGWPRSYPCGGFGEGGKDALAYSPAGFIWDNARAHGKTVRDYGEFTTSYKRWKDNTRKGEPDFLDCYRDFVNGSNAITYWNEPDIETLRAFMATNFPSWDLDVPDVVRAARFIEELKQFEQAGDFPHLTLLWLPNDHTNGTKPGSPTPAAQVADNDLAVGRIIEAVSHSRFWKDTCIFAIEDDPQAGWDHVSGYRTTAYVVSPYTRRQQVVKTRYNQTSLLRTIELILGLPPMNQLDATATPLFQCFTDTPDFTPFDAVPNNVALDEMNPRPQAISDPVLRKDALASARLPLDRADECPEDEFNRILWRAMKGSQVPYPLWAVRIAEED